MSIGRNALFSIPFFWGFQVQIFWCKAFPYFPWRTRFSVAPGREAIIRSILGLLMIVSYFSSTRLQHSLWIQLSQEDTLPVRANASQHWRNHFSGNFQLCLFFVQVLVTIGQDKLALWNHLANRLQQVTYHTVPVQILEAVGSMVQDPLNVIQIFPLSFPPWFSRKGTAAGAAKWTGTAFKALECSHSPGFYDPTCRVLSRLVIRIQGCV